uniref:Uncharacterized protein n=1 Tax=Helianthus annuus TaxID=4232 RepID=A0A251UXW0_HELAN
MVHDPDPEVLLRITICQRNKDHWLGSRVRIIRVIFCFDLISNGRLRITSCYTWTSRCDHYVIDVTIPANHDYK